MLTSAFSSKQSFDPGLMVPGCLILIISNAREILSRLAATSAFLRPCTVIRIAAKTGCAVVCRCPGTVMGGAGKRDAGCEVGGSRTGGIHTELQQEEPRHSTGTLM